MTTVINTPAASNDGGNGMGFFMGIIVLLVIVFLFFYYGLPMLRRSSVPTVNIPDKIDVNVNSGGQ